MRRVVCALAALSCVLAPVSASAHTLVSELLVRVLLSEVVLATQGHEGHFQGIQNGQLAPGFDINQFEIPLAINSVIASQLSTIPLGSSSGGFSYTFNPSLGTFSRTSSTFGSAFAERALTGGRGRWNVGFNFQRATFDTLEGKDLNGGIKVYLTHQDTPPQNTSGGAPQPFFEGDVIENQLSLKLTSSTLATFVNYGLNDRMDVGIVVPFVTIDMNASVHSRVIPLGTSDFPSPIHLFSDGTRAHTITERSHAQGIGDVVLRGKLRVIDKSSGGIAAGVDLRLPTGYSGELLGSGGVQTKVTFIGSMATSTFAPHVNLAYTISTADEPASAELALSPNVPNELSYVAGFDQGLTPRLTVSADVIGRSLRGLGRLVAVPRQFLYTTFLGQFGSASFEEFTRQEGDLNQTALAIGVRFNPRGSLLISGSVLATLSKAGLRDRVTPVIGVDYSF